MIALQAHARLATGVVPAAGGGAVKRRRGEAAADELHALLTHLGLTGPLGHSWGLYEPGGGGILAASLMGSLTASSVEAWDVPRTKTAARWFQRFMLATGRSTPFRPALDNLEGGMYNQATLDMFQEYIKRSPPMGVTLHGSVGSATIAGYGSAIHSVRSREARYDIAPASLNLVMPLALKRLRYLQGPAGERRRSVGLHTSDLTKAARKGLDRVTTQGAVDWAALLAGINLMLRGGELGIPDDQVVDPKRIISWASIQWMRPRSESKNRPWLIVRVVPIKDTHAKAKGYPCPIGRRHDGEFGSDPLCTYDAMAIAWWARRAVLGAPFPIDQAGKPMANWFEHPSLRTRDDTPCNDEPFFTQEDGSIFNTSHVRELCRKVAVLADIDPADIGAKCLRIAGASEWRALMGCEGATHAIKQRGRWLTDIADIYSRPLLTAQLGPSMSLGLDCGIGLEQICLDFAQPRYT